PAILPFNPIQFLPIVGSPIIIADGHFRIVLVFYPLGNKIVFPKCANVISQTWHVKITNDGVAYTVIIKVPPFVLCHFLSQVATIPADRMNNKYFGQKIEIVLHSIAAYSREIIGQFVYTYLLPHLKRQQSKQIVYLVRLPDTFKRKYVLQEVAVYHFGEVLLFFLQTFQLPEFRVRSIDKALVEGGFCLEQILVLPQLHLCERVKLKGSFPAHEWFAKFVGKIEYRGARGDNPDPFYLVYHQLQLSSDIIYGLRLI